MSSALDTAIFESPVADWRSSIAAIAPQTSPCPYLPIARWMQLRHSALDFIARFGEEAHMLGWTAAELFGVDPDRGTRRVRRCGALMVDGRMVYRLELNTVRFTASASSTDKFDLRPGIPVWDFVASRR